MGFDIRIQHRQGAFNLDVDFSVPDGLTVLFGRSGCGKSTVIRAVAGLLRPENGHIRVGARVLFDSKAGRDLPVHRRRVGYVFQEGLLFPHMNVRRNLMFGQRFAPTSTGGDGIDQIVELLGIEPLLERRPAQLSGGEKQRVAIGRALLAGPDVLLADEPLSALDGPRKSEILPYFERLRDEMNIPILYVSHSPSEVARLATTVVAMDAGQIQKVGPAADVLSDANVTPLGVRGAGAVIIARVKCHHSDGLTELDANGVALFLPIVAKPVGADIRLRIAAHDVVISDREPKGLSSLNVFPAFVEAIKPGHGPGALLTLRTPSGQILARVTKRSLGNLSLSVGSECFAVAKSVAVSPEDVGAV